MLPVSKIWNDAKGIVGSTDDVVYSRLTDAVEILANKGSFDPQLGGLDICVSDRLVALPREVDTVLKVNMLGNPTIARDQAFRFHINGPGQCGAVLRWEWDDLGKACTYRELTTPSKLLGFCEKSADENANVRVYGLDKNNNEIRTLEGSSWVTGWKLPVFVNQQALPDDAPEFARITRVTKPVTSGPIRISTPDNDDQSGILLGVYQWDETEPQFRRIRLSTAVPWVRILFRRATFELRSQTDLLPVNSRQAILLMLRAIKKYHEPNGVVEAEELEATATRLAMEEHHTHSAPVVHPIEVHDVAPLNEPYDYVN